MNKRLSITLTEEQDNFLNRLIRAGLVINKKEFVQRAIEVHIEKGEEILKRTD